MSAVRALDIDNLPTQKDEAWKYTPIKRAVPTQLTFVDEEVIHCTCGQKGGEVKEIILKGMDGRHSAPELKVTVEDECTLTLIEKHEGEGTYWKNMTTQIYLGKNATLNHIRICNDDNNSVLTNFVDVRSQEKSLYNCFTLINSGKMVRNDVTSHINGENAHVGLGGVSLLKDQQLGDHTILMNHNVPNATSDQFFRNVLTDRSSGVFQGKVYVDKLAQKTDATQMCKTILLSDRAEMNTKPELEIYADDVLCAHGATTGQIDDNALFYMRSRGIAEEDARMLLIKAFVQEAIDMIKDDPCKEMIETKVEEWLTRL